MKICKNILFITTLFIVGSMDAKLTKQPAPTTTATIKPRPGEVPVVAPAPAGVSYMSLLAEIRAEKISGQIITEDGEFTGRFLNRIKSSGLAPEFMEALLQAGRNLHLPLTGDNTKDQKSIAEVGKSIDSIIGSETKAIVPYRPTDEFYDETSNFLNQSYLEARINALLPTKTADQVVSILSPGLTQHMSAAWKEHGVQVTAARLNQVQEQIKNTAKRLEAQQKEAGALVPYQEKAIVPYQPIGMPNLEEIDRLAQAFVAMMISPKKDTLKNDLLTSRTKNYSRSFINDILRQLYRKYPTINQEQAIRMITVAIDLPVEKVLPFVIETVRKYGKAPKAVPMIEYKPSKPATPANTIDMLLIREARPQTDPELMRRLQEMFEKEREKELQIVPFTGAEQKGQP